MNFTYIIEADVQHVSGKFASREEIGEALAESLSSADPGTISTDEGEYEVASFDVDEQPQAPRRARRPRPAAEPGEAAPVETPGLPKFDALDQLWTVLAPLHREPGDVLQAYAAARTIVARELGLDLARIDAEVAI